MKVLIPGALLSYTGATEVEAEGATLGAVFNHLEARFPGLRFRVIDEQDQFRRHMRCFVNAEQTFDLHQAVRPTDEIAIVQALSGG